MAIHVRSLSPAVIARWLILVFASLAASVGTAVGQTKITIAVPYLVSQVEPFNRLDPVNRIILANVGYGPVRAVHGNVELQLAERVERIDGARVWRCVLKSGLVFQDGRAVVAPDIKRGFEFYQQRAVHTLSFPFTVAPDAQARRNRQVAPEPDRALAQKILNISQITVETTDKAPSLLFSLKQADADFDRDVLSLPLVDPDVARPLLTDFGTTTLVPLLGPYRVIDLRPSHSLTLEAVAIRTEGELPPIRTIELLVFESPRSALSALRNGNVTIIAFPTAAQFGLLGEDPTAIKIDSPLKNLVTTEGWRISNTLAETTDNTDPLTTEFVVVRKSLDFGELGLRHFDLSQAKFTLENKLH